MYSDVGITVQNLDRSPVDQRGYISSGTHSYWPIFPGIFFILDFSPFIFRTFIFWTLIFSTFIFWTLIFLTFIFWTWIYSTWIFSTWKIWTWKISSGKFDHAKNQFQLGKFWRNPLWLEKFSAHQETLLSIRTCATYFHPQIVCNIYPIQTFI